MSDSPTLAILRRTKRPPTAENVSRIELSMALLRVAKRLLGTFVGHFEAAGISPGKYTILAILLEDPRGLPPSVIAQRAGVTRATITGLLDGLERDQYLARSARADDRRTILVTLTKKGTAFMQRFLPGHVDRLQSVTGALGQAQRKALVTLLDQVERSLEPKVSPSAGPRRRGRG